MITGYVRITTRAGLTKSGRRAQPGRGRIKHDSGRHNLVVNASKAYLGQLVRGNSYVLGAMAVGSDDTALDVADTTLGAELGRVGVPSVGTDTATQKNIQSGGVVTLRNTITGITGTIKEYGTFGALASPPGAADAGTLFNRALIGPDAVIATDVTTIETVLTFA